MRTRISLEEHMFSVRDGRFDSRFADGRLSRLAISASLIALFSSMGCMGLGGPPPSSDTSPETVDPTIYSRVDDPTDPYRYKYAEFRERRARDQVDPNSPDPIEWYGARHRSSEMAWGDIEALLPFDWVAIREEAPAEVDDLFASLRIRLAFDHPDLEIRQLILGAGGLLPAHADGAPGAYIVIGGRGEISVDGEAFRVTRGATAKLEPYAERRIIAYEDAPLRLLWIRWAPGGDQAYIDSGYYLTGANQHLQPAQANFGDDYDFWGEPDTESQEIDSTRPAVAAAANSIYAREASARADALEALGESGKLYPKVPVFGHADEIPWLSEETLRSGGFFFSDDVGSLGAVVDRMIKIARHKAIFRATRPDGRWDFNFSQSAWGARSTYVEHSHVIPEFYYVLSGPVIYGVDGERHESLPGDILFNNSYSPHLAQGIVDGLVFRSFSSTFAPNGDRSVFDRPGFLTEPLPNQPDSARLADDILFHPAE